MAARKRKPKKREYGLKPPRMRPIRRDEIEAIRAKARRSATDQLEVIWSAWHGDQTAHFVLQEMYLQHLKQDRGKGAGCFLGTFACVTMHYQRKRGQWSWPEWWPWEDPAMRVEPAWQNVPGDHAATVQ